MRSGVTPFAYDAAVEQVELDAEAARIKAAAGAREAGKINNQMRYSTLKELPPELVERIAETLQRKMKSSIHGCHDGHHGEDPLIARRVSR